MVDILQSNTDALLSMICHSPVHADQGFWKIKKAPEGVVVKQKGVNSIKSSDVIQCLLETECLSRCYRSYIYTQLFQTQPLL